MATKPKKAVLTPLLFDTVCPHCGGDLHAPSGSVQWHKDELDGSTIKCIDCNNPVILPNKQKPFSTKQK